MAGAKEILDLIDDAAKREIARHRTIMDNHLQESQEVIANVAALDAINETGDALADLVRAAIDHPT